MTVNFGTTELATALHHLRAVLRDAAPLELPADHESGDVLKEHQRNAPEIAQLDEMRRFQRRFRKQHAVVRDDADQKSVESREAGHERRAVARLELVEPRTVDDARDDLAHVVGPADVGVDDAVKILGCVVRLFRRDPIGWWRARDVQRRDNGPTAD